MNRNWKGFVMTERQKLCKILHLWLKDYNPFYMKIKYDNNYKDSVSYISRDLKHTQKVLEYLRKGHDYTFYKNTMYKDLGIVTYHIKTKGRDTWRKNPDAEFEAKLNDFQYDKYNDKLLREKKLKRILK